MTAKIFLFNFAFFSYSFLRGQIKWTPWWKTWNPKHSFCWKKVSTCSLNAHSSPCDFIANGVSYPTILLPSSIEFECIQKHSLLHTMGLIYNSFFSACFLIYCPNIILPRLLKKAWFAGHLESLLHSLYFIKQCSFVKGNWAQHRGKDRYLFGIRRYGEGIKNNQLLNETRRVACLGGSVD